MDFRNACGGKTQGDVGGLHTPLKCNIPVHQARVVWNTCIVNGRIGVCVLVCVCVCMQVTSTLLLQCYVRVATTTLWRLRAWLLALCSSAGPQMLTAISSQAAYVCITNGGCHCIRGMCPRDVHTSVVASACNPGALTPSSLLIKTCGWGDIMGCCEFVLFEIQSA